MDSSLSGFVQRAAGKPEVKLKVLNRLDEGRITRHENPASHVCVYFAAFDPTNRSVFIGHHKKSGLWLFNGGHIDPGEMPTDTLIRESQEEWGIAMDPADIPDPSLVTITEIEHPEQQVCEWHYDLWYFLQFSAGTFGPDPDALATEFFETGWHTYDQAKARMVDPASREAIEFLENS